MNPVPAHTPPAVTGLILAGGLGRRMGGVDKGLQALDARPMVAHVIERLAPQVAELLINANRHPAQYAAFGYRVVPDALEGYAGPLAGLERGLAEASHPLVVTAPCDSPFLPLDLVARLRGALIDRAADLAVAVARGRQQPVFCLCDRRLHAGLRAYLAEGGRRIDRWYAGLRVAEVDFDDQPDAFDNINTPDELSDAQRLRAPGGS